MLKQSILLSTSALLALSLAAPAFAQSFDDEIIVTATKRATTLQDTPVAVSVTSQTTIDRAAIKDIKDLQSVVPSLRINQLQNSQNTNFIIRGFGNGANNAGIEPSVGVFIDGVYRSRSAASIGDLPKLERVEVLNGPQSTLFGKNASAGVISVVTAKPSFDPYAHFELGAGNFGAWNAKAYATGALSDDLAVSIGAGINKRDGYAESIDPALADVNDRDRFNIRGQALYEPTDNLSMRLIADYSTLDENCCVVSNLVSSVTTNVLMGIGGGSVTSNIADPFSYTAYQNSDSVNTLDDYGVSFHVDLGLDAFDITSITSFRENDSSFSSDADYNRLNLLDAVSSDQSTSTFTQEVRLTSNSDNNLDWMVGGFLFLEDVDQIGGLEYGSDLRTYIDVLAGGAATLGTFEALFGFAPGTFFSGNTAMVETFTQSNTAYSLFGTADYHVSDRLTITGGLNYTNDAKDVTGSTVNNDAFSTVDLFTDPTGLPGNPTLPQVLFAQAFTANTGLAATPANIAAVEGGAPGTSAAINAGVASNLTQLQALQFQPQFLSFPNSVESGQTRDDKLTWLARAGYEVNDDLNLYVSAATGFKSSSWNLSRDSLPFSTDQVAITAAGLQQPNQNYGTRYAAPEEALVFEAGLKAKFNRGGINMAVFQQTLKGFQENAFVGTAFVLTNAGETRVRGIEFDARYEPVNNFQVTLAGTFLDPEYTDYKNASGPISGVSVDRTGDTPDNISEVSLSLGATYNHDFSNGMSGYLRGDFQYESPTTLATNLTLANLAVSASANPLYTTTGSYPGYEEREQKLFNASAGLDFNNGVSMQIWARNLFNDEYISTLFPGVAQFGIINGYPSQPRTYGINARYTFD